MPRFQNAADAGRQDLLHEHVENAKRNHKPKQL
jgi:hypothetical protein